MLYRAKFCNHCGEKIERAESKFTDSRRFCDLCATDFTLHEWAPRIVTAFFCIAILMVVKARIFSAADEQFPRPQEAPATRSRTLAAPRPAVAEKPEAADGPENTRSEVAPSSATDETFRKPERVVEASDKSMFVCGAPTKKGTPCSRKVKTRGFCWQHRKRAE
jgi:hypothetical protein